MRILILNYEYPPLGGGAAPVCRDLAEGIARAGHQGTVVTMGFPGLAAHEESGGVEVFRLKCLRTKAHACMPWEQFSYILAAKRFLKHHLHSRHYDICHTHFVIPTGLVAKWVKSRYGIPFVITAHGSDVEGYNEKTLLKIMHRLLRPAWRRIVSASCATVAPSQFLLDLMNLELRGGPYLRIPNGLELSKYHADPIKKEKRVLLMGRLQKTKNLQTVFKAIARIPDEIWGDWTVDVLGDGPHRAELEKQCAELGMDARVSFHGWIENGSKEHFDFLGRAAIYVSASHFENCPMAVLEAIAAGCRPLLSDIEGHRQFFRDVKESERYFFPENDERILADKMTSLLRQTPSTAFGSLDLSAYDLQQIVMRYISLLEKYAVQEHGPQGSGSEI